MNSTLVRIAIAALAVTGFCASTVISHPAAKAETKPVVVAGVGTGGAPLCWPGRGTCGME